MNPNKKPTGIIVAVIAIIIIIVIVLINKKPANPPDFDQAVTGSSTPSAAVSEITKVSNTLSEYQNAELGFSVKYPSTWDREETNSGITFIVPIDKNQVSSVANLGINVQALSATCAFPPVTTVKEHTKLKVGDKTLDMISMSNNVQGRTYFNRMYSLQDGSNCFMFSFAAITLSPSSKGLTGSQITQATNNNKAIVNTADSAFIEMVKSFALITGPQGTDETTASPSK